MTDDKPKREPIVPSPSIQRMADALLNGMGEHAVRFELHADECLIYPTRSRLGRCVRKDHPTPTSDCTTQEWIRHVSEDDQ